MTKEVAFGSEQKTVLHIFSGDLWAGAEVMIFHLLNELGKRPNVKIIALSLNDGILARKLQEVKIETYVVSETNHSFAMILWRVSQALKGRKIDVIHSHRYKENLLAVFLAKWIGAKCLVTTLHGLPEAPHQWKDRNQPMVLKTKINFFFLKHFFSRVAAVSKEIQKVLIRQYHFIEEQVDVVYNGIPLPILAPLSDDSKDLFHIGTVGRMVSVKDFDLFLDVAAEIRRQTDRVRFTILGEGPLREKLVQKAKTLKIEGSIEFLPPRPDPVPGYYQTLDLYLNTSLHEGIPLSILEAMACGRPVVAPRVGGIPEIIVDGEEGFLIEGRDPKAFAQGCLALLNDKKRRAAMGENASKRVAACFSNSRMADAYLELYHQMIGRN